LLCELYGALIAGEKRERYNEQGGVRMDNQKVGVLIRRLRREKGITQLQLAKQLHISDKTVSKWERGLGFPDVSLLQELARVFEVDMQSFLSGELGSRPVLSGNMRKMMFYVCPDCGNLVLSMVETPVFCCGRKLKAVEPVKALPEEKLTAEISDGSFHISSSHEMTKSHYIAFVALLTADTVMLKKQYPEWDLSVRLPFFAHGRLYWYCTRHGLFYQEV
jgi:DNA-binding XRE family transcriptional regulator/desulfoferrodoxin (superoxide reductase-like protein)